MESIRSQASEPHGAVGVVFSWLMERMNRAANEEVVKFLKPLKLDAILELGFGPGQLIDRVHQELPDAFIAGIDPSELMVAKAKKRNHAAIEAHRVDLRLGRADSLPWADSSIDAAVAVHSFQFWATPSRVFSEVRRVLRADGTFLIVLRDHRRRAPAWLPNPLSCEHDECSAAIRELSQSGFADAKSAGKFARSQAVSAKCL